MVDLLNLSCLGGFLGINFYILWSDIRRKKIPNIGLLMLLAILPFCYLFSPIFDFSLPVIIGSIITLIISFALYYFGVWSAGDAKYLAVLGLFVGNFSILSLIGNLALITIIYLMFHTLNIYIIKLLSDFTYTKDLWASIGRDVKERIFDTFRDASKNKITKTSLLKTLLPLLLGFLIFFTALRLVRIYALSGILGNDGTGGGRGEWLLQFIIEYNVYILLACVSIFILSFRSIYKGTRKLFDMICQKCGVEKDVGLLYAMGIASIFLIAFISYQYFQDAAFITQSLWRIFTFYIFLFLFLRFLVYVHYVTFQLSEIEYRPITKLRAGDIVDKVFLERFFGDQESLGFNNPNGKYAPAPSDFFKKIDNPIDKKTSQELKKIYSIVENYNKKSLEKYEPMREIRIYRTFAFAPYLFIGVCVTLLFGNQIMMLLITKCFELLGVL